MDYTLYEGRRYHRNLFVRVASVINLSLVAATIFAWPYVALILADPIGAASHAALSRVASPALFDFPFVVIWGLPLGMTVLSWVLSHLGARELARLAALYPTALFATSWFWFHYLRYSLLSA